LELQIAPKVFGGDVQPASLRYQTSAGETFSITRLSYFVTDVALQRDDGSWIEFTNSVGWLDLGENRDSIRLDQVPPGDFRSLRFLIGLNPGMNHQSLANIPPDSPLNPDVNHLYWGWQSNYVFMALEGLWRNSSGELDGWAYHLARDTNAVHVILAADMTITNETKIQLDFDLANVLNAPRPLSFVKDGTSTHSRDGDPIAAALVENLPTAFRLSRITALTDAQIAVADPRPLYLPAKFTPYQFQMSAIFPIPDLPRDNPLTVERVTLGKALFNDKRLSVNDRQSCADCHLPDKAYQDGRRTARGAEGDLGLRKTMPLFNLAWKQQFFWDGRATSLRQQILIPIQNPIEMHQTLTNLVAKLAGVSMNISPDDPTNEPPKTYSSLFENAFGSREITAEKVSLAIENYILTLTSFNSKFDHVITGQEKFTPQEEHGFELFSTEYDPRRGQYGADCFHCHGGPLFQSQNFANNGLDDEFLDPGRERATGRASDLGKFAVSSLRNVALRAPYMHDGRFQTLDEVVEHYCTGVKRSATLDPNIAKHPDGGVPLSVADKQALVAFLKTLTDEQLLHPLPSQEYAQY
jgi:cytochrome c peroxidase